MQILASHAVLVSHPFSVLPCPHTDSLHDALLRIKIDGEGSSLAVQWFRFGTFSAMALGSLGGELRSCKLHSMAKILIN